MYRDNRTLTVSHFRAMYCVVTALVLREVKTRFGRYRFGYVWALAEPVAHVVVLSIIFGVKSRTAPAGIEFPIFLATGIIPWVLFRGMIVRGMSTVEANRALFRYRQVKPLDALVARAVLEIVIYSCVFIIFLSGAAWIGYDAAVQNPLGVMAVILTLSLFGWGIGAFTCVLSSFFPDIAQVVPLVMRPFYFLSGIIFSVERIPVEYLGYVLWNPILHAMELIRMYYFSQIDSSYGDPLYLIGWTLGSLALGLLTFQVFRHRMVAS